MQKLGGAATGHPPVREQKCDSSPCDHQSILMKDHFMGTVQIVRNTISFTFLCNRQLFQKGFLLTGVSPLVSL